MTKREKAFVLSLIATIIFPVYLHFFLGLVIRLTLVVTFSLIGLVILIMTAGLLFMRISKTERGRIIGGTIILIMGIGMLVFLMMEGEVSGILLILGVMAIIGAIMAIIGGYLGIQGAREGEVEKRQYSKTSIFIVSIMGFISALLSIFAFFLPTMIGMDEWSAIGIFYLITIPFWVISIILNTISTVNIVSTVVKREEITPEKRTKILIIVTWLLIALPGLYLLPLFLQ